MKKLGLNDVYTVLPRAVKSSDGKSPLGNIKLGSGKSLNKYSIAPYSKEIAKNNYIALPGIGPFMMVYSEQFKKIYRQPGYIG